MEDVNRNHMPQQKIRILHVTPSYKPAYGYGGPILSVARLCEVSNHEAYGLESVVFTTTANGAMELDLKGKHNMDGVSVFFYPRLTGDHTHFSPALLLGLHRYLRQAKTGRQALVVHIHSWWNLVAVLAAALAIMHHMPLIISLRGMITSYTRAFRNTIMKQITHVVIGRYLLKKALLHATSALEAQDIHQHNPTSIISVIPNLLTDARGDMPRQGAGTLNVCKPTVFKRVSTSLNPKLHLLFLSRIDQKKGLELLLQALSTVTFPWSLTIAGMGSSKYIRYLKLFSARLKVCAHINWIGQVENDVKFTLLAEHDLLVLPSSNENFGNVVLESLLAGTAVLVSDQVGLAAYVSKTGLGWVCRPQFEDIALKLSNIHADLAKRLQIRNCAAQQIRLDFSTQSIMQEYQEMYQNVMRQHAGEGTLPNN